MVGFDNGEETYRLLNEDKQAPAALALASARVVPAINANLTITFNQDVSVLNGWFGISCGTSGSHGAGVTGGPTTFTLDPTQERKTMDITIEGGVMLTLYQLDGDRLTLAIGNGSFDTDRPKDFSSTADNKFLLFVYKRQK